MSTPEKPFFWPTDDPNYEKVDRVFQTLEGDEDADYNKLEIPEQYIWNVRHFESAVCNLSFIHKFFGWAEDFSNRWHRICAG